LIKDRDALLTFYDFPAEPPAISGGAGLEHPSISWASGYYWIENKAQLPNEAAL
jgi:hypothetical protein